MYEHHSEPVLPRAQFIRRVDWHVAGAILLLGLSLGAGAASALYSGLVFIVCAALALTPTLHRMLHTLHLDEED